MSGKIKEIQKIAFTGFSFVTATVGAFYAQASLNINNGNNNRDNNHVSQHDIAPKTRGMF
jgi:hypothetical protein